MSAVAIFSCRQNSHPFQERHISLHEPVKIGRSVARARSSPSNGTFDCKVLSRNHAMLWYSNGKFHLQDTKSSNGTFVNNQRLSKGSEESAPREIFSGDLIQFGVEVMENNRRGEKITHGCIIATVTLFHPDGREAKPVYPNSSSYLSLPSQPGVTIQSQELYQLAHYLQEALHREQMLEQKLVALQELVQRTQEASENGWQALIDEDRLLSRLEVLESQLNTYSKNYAEDTLRQELVALQEDKHNYETTAKESLRRVLQEKLEAVRKISDLERSLGNAESECCHLKEMCEVTQDELQILAEKYQDQIKEVQELQEKLQEAENIHQEEMEKVEQEKQELTEKIEEMTKEEKILSAKVESLQADNDISKEQLTAMKSKLANSKELEDDNRIIHLDGGQVDIIPLSQKDEAPKDLQEKLHETQEQIGNYKAKIEELELQLRESSSKVEQLQRELEIANEDSEKCYEKITILEEKLKLSDLHMNQMMENAMADLRLQLKEAQRQTDCSTELNKQLEEQIESLEKDLASYKIPHSKLMASESSDTTAPKVSSPQSVCNHMDSRPAATKSQKSSEVDKLKELLQKARHEQKRTEQELLKCKEELEVARKKSEKSAKELIGNKEKLFDSQIQAKERMETINDLQEQLKKAEASTKDVKEQILNLRDSLLEEQEQSHIKQVEAEKLRNLLDREKTKQKEAQVELHGTKRQLQEAQQSAKQNRNEAEQLRNKVKHLHEELELLEKSPKTRDIHHSKHTAHQELHRTPPRNKSELIALKEECTNLRKRIQAIEAEMKLSRKENLQLSSDYNKLQESYRELEALKQKLEHKEILWKSNMTDAQKEAQQAKEELSKATDGISDLKSKCEKCSEQVGNLQGELTDVLDEYRNLRDKSKLLSFISSIPLLMLLFALLLALYPTLEDITATSSLS